MATVSGVLPLHASSRQVSYDPYVSTLFASSDRFVLIVCTLHDFHPSSLLFTFYCQLDLPLSTLSVLFLPLYLPISHDSIPIMYLYLPPPQLLQTLLPLLRALNLI